MSHARTQIRQAVKVALAAGMTDYKVFASRKFSINSSELPCVDMKFLNENSNVSSMGRPAPLDRVASLYIRCTLEAASEDMDDQLDDAAVLVEGVMYAADLSDVLIDIELKQTNFTDGAAGDTPVAEIVLRYDVLYRTTEADAETIRG